MADYSVTVDISQATRTYLKGHSYSMYVFKGIQAGGGAISTVWQVISGESLYGNETNQIAWTEDFYIGETNVSMSSGAKISGTDPYNGPVQLGQLYTYTETGWNPNSVSGPTSDAFSIANKPSQTNNFYVSQKQGGNFIVVQNLTGAGGVGTFQPVEKIAIILTTQPYNTGTLIVQTFSPGIVVCVDGNTPTATVKYDKDNGWSGPTSQATVIGATDSLYDAILNNAPS